MENVLKDLKPEAVFRNFEALTRIPRGSGNEKGVSDFLVEFAKKNGLEVIQEDCLNVIIKKPATKGYEKAKRVILQGHMDMVCTKKPEIEFDFEKDPISIYVDGDMIRTKGTTLGADNGIAVAMAMSVLESKELEHPEVAALITIAEETGMDGVLALDPANISGDILINIDSEEEGVLLASCAGGVNNIVHLPVKWHELPSSKKSFKVSISGLLGGHSGIEINKNRANAIKLMGRLLEGLQGEVSYSLCSVSGGEKMNAIAKMSDAVIAVAEEDVSKLNSIVDEYKKMFRFEFETQDPSISISIEELKTPENSFDDNTRSSLIKILRLMPNGVQTMSENIEGLVESSTNIGVLETTNDEIRFDSAVRSSVKSLKDEINSRIDILASLTGATMELVSDYPQWEYRVESEIRDVMSEVYRNMYGKDIKVDAIHAGLECGFLKEKLGDIDMVSLGPDMYDVHTPNEHLSISSTRRVYEFLCQVLKNVK